MEKMIKMEERASIKCFDEDLKLVDLLFGKSGFEMFNKNKEDMVEIIYNDRRQDEIKDYVDFVKNFFETKCSKIREYKKQLDDNVTWRRKLHWWQLIKRSFMWWQKKQILNNINMCKKNIIAESYTDFTRSLSDINNYLKTQHSKNLPGERQQNEINTKNDHKTNPISKVVKENIEMTANKKRDQNYLKYSNKMNSRIKKDYEQNIDERNNN